MHNVARKMRIFLAQRNFAANICAKIIVHKSSMVKKTNKWYIIGLSFFAQHRIHIKRHSNVILTSFSTSKYKMMFENRLF